MPAQPPGTPLHPSITPPRPRVVGGGAPGPWHHPGWGTPPAPSTPPKVPVVALPAATGPPTAPVMQYVHPSPPRSVSPSGMHHLQHITHEVSAMAERVQREMGLEKDKLALESQVTKLQKTLQAVNSHLEKQQMDAAAEAESSAAEIQRLERELAARDREVEESLNAQEQLRQRAAELAEELEKQQRAFQDEKEQMNAHFVRTGHELFDAKERLGVLEKEGESARKENEILKGWLDRGVEECRRATEEKERSKKALERVSGDWQVEQSELKRRLAQAESDLKQATHERGALAVNLTAARARLVDDSRNMHNVVPIMRYLLRRCGMVEAAVVAGKSSPLADTTPLEFSTPPPPPPPDGELTSTYDSQAVRDSTEELYAGFLKMCGAVKQVLDVWGRDHTLADDLQRKLKEAQLEVNSLRGTSERLRMELGSANAELEKWRQRAFKEESGGMQSDTPLTRMEKQELIQAQTVAATLYKEKEALALRVSVLRREAEELRTNYDKTDDENKALRAEIARLRAFVSAQAAQFDAVQVAPPNV